MARRPSSKPVTAALALAAKGIPVFPCWNKPNKTSHKTPHTPHGFKDATRDPVIIRNWWKKWPNALIGMVTGPMSGIDVLDLDTKNGKDGLAAVPGWKKLSPVISRTVNGGAHIYFKSDGTIRCTADQIAPGVDTRGVGGYVIVPPSEGYSWVNGYDLSNLPTWPRHLRPRERAQDLFINPNTYPDADPNEIAAAMLKCPNLDLGWDDWNRIGMACFAAFNGSEKGFVAFDTWSRKSSKYEAEVTREKWAKYQKSPPDQLTVGTIFDLANKASPGWRAEFNAEQSILDPNDPMQSARALVAASFKTADGQTLYRHRGAFWQWNGSYYQLADDETIKAQVWAYLENARRQTAKGPMPFKPKRASVGDVLEAFGAATQLGNYIDPPAWLKDGDIFPPQNECMACANGLLHLLTGKLYPPTPNYFCLNASEVSFDPKASKPVKWLAFLDQLFGKDQQAKNLLQEWFGYLLAPDTSQQKILLIYGPKRSGKGTIARIVRELLGAASVGGPTASSLSETFGLEPLITKTLAILADMRIGSRTDKSAVTERLLSISGEDALTVHRKNKQAWDGPLKVRVIILTNELPALSDGSGALAGRFVILGLTNSFYGKEDPALTGKLLAELPGILNWALVGYRRLKDRGHFVMPKSAFEAVEQIEMLAAPVKAFVQSCCIVASGLTVLSTPEQRCIGGPEQKYSNCPGFLGDFKPPVAPFRGPPGLGAGL